MSKQFSITCPLVIAVMASAMLGCGKPRRYGDEGGIPIAFSVTLDRAFVSDMRNRQARPSVGAGVGFGSGGHSSIGTGVGLSFSATTVYILGGDSVGTGNLFRKELEWGENHFTVPLKPGRQLALTVQAQGGREGWEGVGTVYAPAVSGGEVRIELGSSGPKIIAPIAEPIQPAPAATTPDAIPSTPTTPSIQPNK